MAMKILPLLMVLSWGASTAFAQLPEEALQCFQWFSTLGYPDVKDARWAEAWTGSYSSSGPNNEPQAHTSTGFITEETAIDFKVVWLDLTQGRYQKSKPGLPAHQRVGFEERPFVKMVEDYLDTLKNPPRNGIRRFGAKLNHKAEVFCLSYVCWQKGQQALAAQLYEQAQKLPHEQVRGLPDTQAAGKEVASMQEALELDLGHAAMWDAVLRCGGGRLGSGSWGISGGKPEPLADVLEAFRRVVRLFPRCGHVERARKSIAMLERMVEEEKQHPTLSQEQIDKLPLDQRIAELVWRLRDQNGHQWSQPGWCDVFSTHDDAMGMNGKGSSPAHQLLAIGDAAAPALIEALTDGRFSRSVGFGRNFFFSHTVLTVGDCAQQILERMTGQNFYRPGATSGQMSDEDKMRQVQKFAQQCWRERQQKSKKQMLVDTIAAGKTQPNTLVEQLRKEAPDAVADAVLRGADNAENDWLARQFIEELAALKSPKATERLARFMKEHGNVEVRLGAAGWLLNQNHPGALAAVLHEWRVLPPADHGGREDGFEEVVVLLLASGDTGAMQKLVERWEDRPVRQRFEIVSKLGEWLASPPASRHFTQVKPRPVQPEARELAIALLARALEDTEKRSGMSGSMGDFAFRDPRICDFALWALHEIEPKKYVFSPPADRRQRDAERITAANLWRKEHQKPLLPPPPPPGPKVDAKDALKIVKVLIKPERDFAGTPLVRRALELRGKAFDPKTLSSLLVEFAQGGVPGASGLRVEATREGDLTGVELHLRFTPGTFSPDESQSWGTMHSGQIGTKFLGSSGGSSVLSYLKQDTSWQDFDEDIRDGLKSLAPTAAFTLSAGVQAP